MIISWDGCFFGYEKSTFWGKNIMVCCKKVLNWNTWFPRAILARPLQSWLLGQSYQKGLLALEDERNQTIPCLFGNGSKIWDCVTNFSVFNRYFSDVRSCPMREDSKLSTNFVINGQNYTEWWTKFKSRNIFFMNLKYSPAVSYEKHHPSLWHRNLKA